MATQFVEGQPRVRGESDRRVEIVGAGSMVVALGAAAAIVLAILGLAGALPGYMVTIATIVLGGALLFEGGAVVARYHRIARDAAQPSERPLLSGDVGAGMTAESLAGIAGVALGILALLGLAAYILVPVALIAFGGGLLLGSAAVSRLQSVQLEGHAAVSESMRSMLRELGNMSIGGQVLVGTGAIVLGILALLGLSPLTLTLVGMLAVGFSLLMSGSAIGARMLGIIRHEPGRS
jgi:hypothetical protein